MKNIHLFAQLVDIIHWCQSVNQYTTTHDSGFEQVSNRIPIEICVSFTEILQTGLLVSLDNNSHWLRRPGKTSQASTILTLIEINISEHGDFPLKKLYHALNFLWQIMVVNFLFFFILHESFILWGELFPFKNIISNVNWHTLSDANSGPGEDLANIEMAS